MCVFACVFLSLCIFIAIHLLFPTKESKKKNDSKHWRRSRN